MADITDTLKADSTQLNAVDFTGTSRTYTVSSVRVVSGEQPVNIRLAEEPEGREYRPSKSMRRVLAACWGPDSDTWTGKRLTLYTDPSVKWAGTAIGGIKISHVSGIDGPKKVMLQESSTVRKPHAVQPLADTAPAAPPEPTAEAVIGCIDTTILRGWWQASGAERRAQIEARVAELTATPEPAEVVAANSQWDEPTEAPA